MYASIIRDYPFNPSAHQGYSYRVVKRNKRLFIEKLENGEEAYTPPDFVRENIRNREGLQELAAAMCATNPAAHIKLIIEFERTIYRPGIEA